MLHNMNYATQADGASRRLKDVRQELLSGLRLDDKPPRT